MYHSSDVGRRAEDSFFVTLYSNSDSNSYPDNSPASFANKVAQPINVPRGAGWQVALHSLTCSNLLKQDIESVGVAGVRPTRLLSQINVRCRQVSIPYDGRKLISCHSRKPFSALGQRVHTYEPRLHLYFSLDSDVLTELHIDLLDYNLDLLQYRRSQATVCVLKFQRVMPFKYLPLWIHSNKASQSGDTASNFRITLPPLFNNHGIEKWQVAMTSLTYVPNYVTIPSRLHAGGGQRNMFHAVDLTDDENPLLGLIQREKLHLPSKFAYLRGRQHDWPRPLELLHEPIVISPQNWNYIQTAGDIIDTLMRLFTYFGVFQTTAAADPEDSSSGEPLFKLEWADVDQTRVSLRFLHRAILYMPMYAAHILGFRDYATTEDRALAVFCADAEDEPFVGRRNVDIKSLSPNTISLLCDFIEPAFIGSVRSPVLKTIPMVKQASADDMTSLTYEPRNLEYHSLNTRELSSLHFQIINAAGDEVEFVDDTQNVIIGLVIKSQ